MPGTETGNWQWRLLEKELEPELAKKIFDMSVMYDRTKKPEKPAKPVKTPEKPKTSESVKTEKSKKSKH